jgi:hypothetical protein
LKCLVQVTSHSGEPFLGDEELPLILDLVHRNPQPHLENLFAVLRNSGPAVFKFISLADLATQSFRNNFSGVFSLAGLLFDISDAELAAEFVGHIFHFISDCFLTKFRLHFASISGLCEICSTAQILTVTCF